MYLQDIVANLWSKSCCSFPKLHLPTQNKTGSLLKEKVCVNICTDFCLSKKACSASWGWSKRSLVICRLLTLLFIKCAFHKWHRSSVWPPPTQTLTYYVGCDQATNRLAKNDSQANAQSLEKKQKKNLCWHQLWGISGIVTILNCVILYGHTKMPEQSKKIK